MDPICLPLSSDSERVQKAEHKLRDERNVAQKIASRCQCNCERATTMQQQRSGSVNGVVDDEVEIIVESPRNSDNIVKEVGAVVHTQTSTKRKAEKQSHNGKQKRTRETEEVDLERMMRDWRSPVYAFFKPIPRIEEAKGRPCLVFECLASNCKGGGERPRDVRRFLDRCDRGSTSNLWKHARICWESKIIKEVEESGDLDGARKVLADTKQTDGSWSDTAFLSPVSSTPQLKYINKLSGARVLVLGGISDIGFTVAAAALEHGASVIVSSSQMATVESAVSRLKKAYATDEFHRRISGFTCDTGNPEKLEENILTLLKQSATTADGRQLLLDHVVVAEAGNVPDIKPVQQVTVDYIRHIGSVPFLVPLILAKLVGPYIRQAATSSITLTSGSRAKTPAQGWSAAIGHGSGVEAMTRGLAIDLAPVRFNCVLLDAVRTKMIDDSFLKQTDAFFEITAKEPIIGHVAEPEDVAETYIYVIKDKFRNGSSIHPNGGAPLK